MTPENDITQLDQLPFGQAPLFQRRQQIARFLERCFDGVNDHWTAPLEHILADFTPDQRIGTGGIDVRPR